MLCKGTALMRFAHFQTINSVFCNAVDLRRETRNVVAVPKDKRLSLTRRDVASQLPNSNEECEYLQGGTPRTPPARGPAVTEFKEGSPTDPNVAA
jgi:hypothetical protein